MRVEIRLKQIMLEHRLIEYGIEQKMARACGIHRHTIGKLLRNQMKDPSLEVLGEVCRWLLANGVSAERLPGDLFGFRATNLWTALGSAENVAIYQGAYAHASLAETETKSQTVPMSIASHDASVASNIKQLLSTRALIGDARPVMKTKYVPFQFSLEAAEVGGAWFEDDKNCAKKTYEKILKRIQYESAILLGSQRVNYLVECLVADLFGCEPFKPVNGGPKVPFYLCYRESDRPVPSCFGGRHNPPGLVGGSSPGTYYIDEKGGWNLIEWKKHQQDAAVVIIVREAESVLMAAFGFSGRATCAVGNELLYSAEKFWPNGNEGKSSEKDGKRITGLGGEAPWETVERKGKEVGVYICEVTFAQRKDEPQNCEIEDCKKDKVKVQPLKSAVLERFLK